MSKATYKTTVELTPAEAGRLLGVLIGLRAKVEQQSPRIELEAREVEEMLKTRVRGMSGDAIDEALEAWGDPL